LGNHAFYQRLGYVVTGPATCLGWRCGLGGYLAGGAEYLVRDRIGIGGELGALGGSGGILFALSFNGSVHLARNWPDRRLVPFLTAGFSAIRQEMAEQRTDLLKWAFLFWIGQFFAVSSLIAILVRFLHAGG
jgi:hypothetical protein